jgi:hypothetical protein
VELACRYWAQFGRHLQGVPGYELLLEFCRFLAGQDTMFGSGFRVALNRVSSSQFSDASRAGLVVRMIRQSERLRPDRLASLVDQLVAWDGSPEMVRLLYRSTPGDGEAGYRAVLNLANQVLAGYRSHLPDPV